METIIYVDAFNLYYSALFETPYKWLDLEKLIENKYPTLNIVKI